MAEPRDKTNKRDAEPSREGEREGASSGWVTEDDREGEVLCEEKGVAKKNGGDIEPIRHRKEKARGRGDEDRGEGVRQARKREYKRRTRGWLESTRHDTGASARR